MGIMGQWQLFLLLHAENSIFTLIEWVVYACTYMYNIIVQL